MKTSVEIFAVALLFSAVPTCSLVSPTYKIEAITKEIKHSLSPDYEISDLNEQKRFRLLQEHAEFYVDNSLVFLQESHEFEEKRIVAYGMQSLPFDSYVMFLGRCLTLSESGNLQTELLRECFIPGDDWNRLLQIHYMDPRVKKLLKRAINSKVFSTDDKGWFALTLEGKA